MIVYLVRVIPAFVMYCVNGTSHSSLLIESVDSMIQMYCPAIRIHVYDRECMYVKLYSIGWVWLRVGNNSLLTVFSGLIINEFAMNQVCGGQ